MGRHKKILDRDNMTAQQKAVYNCIIRYVEEKNYPPSVRDICQEVDLKSTSSVFGYINDLQGMGLLYKNPTHPRAIKLLDKNFTTKQNAIDIPVIYADSGEDALNENNIQEYMPFPKSMMSESSMFIFVVDDDSMMERDIRSGDRVIVEQNKDCKNGDLVVAALQKGIAVRSYAKINGNEGKILGKVVGLIRMTV